MAQELTSNFHTKTQMHVHPTHICKQIPSPSGLFSRGEERKELYRHSTLCFSFQHLTSMSSGVGGITGEGYCHFSLEPRGLLWSHHKGPLLGVTHTPPLLSPCAQSRFLSAGWAVSVTAVFVGEMGVLAPVSLGTTGLLPGEPHSFLECV